MRVWYACGASGQRTVVLASKETNSIVVGKGAYMMNISVSS